MPGRLESAQVKGYDVVGFGCVVWFTEIGIEIERLVLRGQRIMGGAVRW